MVASTRPRAVYSLTGATPARTIWVYRNGDPFYLGRKFVINHRYVPNFEAFMIQLNEGVQTPFGVRNLYTPRHGHSVMELTDLQQGGRYVVAGRERFRKLNYFNIGAKKPQGRKRDEVIRPVVHSNIQVPSKWQSIYNKSRNIHVFTNGNMLIQPMKIIIPKFTMESWNSVLGLINEKVVPRSGGIHRLYALNGQLVHGPDDLEDNQFYVGCGKEKFHALPYWQHPKVPEDIRRDYSNSTAPLQKSPRKKPPIEPPKQRAGGRGGGGGGEGGDRPSVYFARPKKASPERVPTTLSSDDGHSVYKAAKRRSEIEGAKVIPEDKDVQVEVPVEQAPAEIVHDEEVYSNADSIEEKSEEDVDGEGKKEKKKGVFKKMFGFFFGKSKKKDEQKLAVGGSTTMAGSYSNASNISGPSPLQSSVAEVPQTISPRPDDYKTAEVMGGIDSLGTKGEDVPLYFESENETGFNDQQENPVDSANVPEELMQETTGDLEAVGQDDTKEESEEQDAKKLRKYQSATKENTDTHNYE